MKFGSEKKPGVVTARLYSSVVRRYERANIVSWSQSSARSSKRRVISRITLSTHWIFPDLQSLADVGSYPEVSPGRSCDQLRKSGSSAVAGPASSEADRTTVTTDACPELST